MPEKRFRCPICGHIVSGKSVLKDFPLEFFVLHGLGRGRGFSFEPVKGGLLLIQLKEKIFAVYNRFFGISLDITPFHTMAEVSDFSMAETSDFDTIPSQFSTLAVVQGKEFDKIGEI